MFNWEAEDGGEGADSFYAVGRVGGCRRFLGTFYIQQCRYLVYQCNDVLCNLAVRWLLALLNLAD